MADVFTSAHRGGQGAPLVLLHGFTDTWRTWELVLAALERHHDVLAPTLTGHAGGPPIVDGRIDEQVLLDAIEAAMDDAGFEDANVVGNSLGGHLALHLAARGRARTVVALAPAGGWAPGDPAAGETLRHFTAMDAVLRTAAAHADQIASTPEGRRRATEFICTSSDHLPRDLVAHLIVGAAGCPATLPLVRHAERAGWSLDAERVTCPVRIVWGTDDRLLRWPSAAVRYREQWLPAADWITLDGVGHCIQLDVPAVAADLILGFTTG